ncbi:alpha/beta fold hydrolase [Methanosphaerula palustris]|uniref:Hydrolase or acyltransferase (Alpha/beta hydrolase superfamily)-like protein n=1 Tax=Methanosphaerula palustris (strain ATCC BAA-1556 / DSM 19958 / E1-9c) TaxID=521011 RepID=B8GGY0_METPE|nr:alpha/beta fold hydrolase [Methanosphaerula palustris]ACL16385.1 hydrolase or acyltransferase (alpha/beta hydrolase superfamily)-like protein [Methanosphaerula palustris E1-9c]
MNDMFLSGPSMGLLILVFCLLVVPAAGQGDGPLMITAPGQYILDHDPVGGGQQGIVISSSDVLLDGGGYQVVGTSSQGSVGVVVKGAQQNVTIRNLSVRSWGTGIRFQSISSGRINGVTAVNCTENGFLLDGCSGISIDSCQALQNGLPGIAINESTKCRLTETQTLQNGDVGMYLLNATGTIIDRCTASENRLNGIFLEQSDKTTINNCQAAWNQYPGIAISGGMQNMITTNLLYGNQIAAVYLEETGRTLVLNNAAGGSPAGLSIVNCTDRVIAGGNRWLTDEQTLVTEARNVSPVPALGPSPNHLHALVALDRASGASVRTGHRVDVGDGRRIALQTSGIGGPVVVMEAGTGDSALSWAQVQQEVGEFTTAVSVDRAGLGWSDPRTGPANATADVSDLHLALHNAGLPPPYLLIGQGRGATIMRLFTHRYPAEVAGLVLVEPEVENEFSSNADYSMVRHQQITDLVLALEKRVGAVDSGYLARNPGLVTVSPHLSLQDQQTDRALIVSHPAFTLAQIDEWKGTDRFFTTVRSELNGMHLGVPVRILLSTDPALQTEGSGSVPEGYRTFRNLQRGLVGNSADGQVMTIQNTTRSLQLDRPDAVTDAIRQLVG